MSDTTDTTGVQTMNDYQRLAAKTAGPHCNDTCDLREGLIYTMVGLNEEAGEYAGHVKHKLWHGWGTDDSELAKELGDILWNVARAAALLNYSLQEIADMNIAKLKKRYPEGFTKDASKNRTE